VGNSLLLFGGLPGNYFLEKRKHSNNQLQHCTLQRNNKTTLHCKQTLVRYERFKILQNQKANYCNFHQPEQIRMNW